MSSSTPANGYTGTKENPEVVAYPRSRTRTPMTQPHTWNRCVRKIFDEIKGEPRRPICRCPPAAATGGITAAVSKVGQYGVHCRCPIADASDWQPPVLDEHTQIPGEQILLDENSGSRRTQLLPLGASSVSPDGHLLAYSVDTVGDEIYPALLLDLRTGELFPDEIPESDPGVTWATDNATVYYIAPSTTPGVRTPCGGIGLAT